MIDIGRIEMVNDKIHQYLKPTRLDKSQYLGANVFLKFECEQPAVRSFKIRGVLGKLLMLTEEEKKKRIVTISSGNQGVCTAYAAKFWDFQTCLFMYRKILLFPNSIKWKNMAPRSLRSGKVLMKQTCWQKRK